MKHKLDLKNKQYKEKTLRENSHLLIRNDWRCISIHQKLSESFIREFKDKVYWPSISIYQKLSEGFIREFKGEVYWHNISIHQKLSEGLIREFKDEVDWYWISLCQKLSKKFMMEFIDLIDVKQLERNDKIPLEDKKEIIAYKLLVG